MAGSFTHFRQLDQMDCGPACLRMVAKHFGKHYSAQTLREKTSISREGVSMLGIAEAAKALGFEAMGVRLTLNKLVGEPLLPCILHWSQNHFVVLWSVKSRKNALDRKFLSRIWGGRKSLNITEKSDQTLPDIPDKNIEIATDKKNSYIFYIADPATGLVSYNEEEFAKKWLGYQSAGSDEGVALLLEPTSGFYEKNGDEVNVLGLGSLLRFLWNYKALVLQLAFGVVVGSGVSMCFPLLTQLLVDTGIGKKNISFIYVILIAQMVLMMSTSAVDFIRRWILLHISVRLNLTILSEFLSKLMRLPVSFFDAKHFGDILQRIGDHQRIESFLTGQALSTLFSVVNLVVFGIILGWYSPLIFTVAVATSCFYAFWVMLFMKKRRKLDSGRFEISSRNQSQIVQLIQGMQDIRLAGAETLKRWEWEQTQAQLFKWNVKNLSISQVQQGGALFINNSKNILISFLAAKAVIDGQLTFGEMVSVQYILGQFSAPVEQMVDFFQGWQDAQISLERLNEIHEMKDEEALGTEGKIKWDQSLDIVIEGLSYTYPGPGNTPVFHDINLTIPKGKVTAIVGVSGGGKTTLLKLLSRFYEPQAGEIFLGNVSDNENAVSRKIRLNAISHRAWRQQCGVVMQEGFLFSDTIAGNIAIHDAVIDQDKLFQAVKTANIQAFIDSLPLGFHTRIGAEGKGISQGQKQRILIARAVYKNPALLLFDEATNALDATTEGIILQNLTEFFKGRTVVVAAHRLSTVKNADQIIVLHKGEILEKGNHAELVSLKGKYFELVTNQLELEEK